MAGSRCRAGGACLGGASGSRLGRLGGLRLSLRLSLVALLALQSRHVIIILIVVLFLLILAAQSGAAAKLREVDAAKVAACAQGGLVSFFKVLRYKRSPAI